MKVSQEMSFTFETSEVFFKLFFLESDIKKPNIYHRSQLTQLHFWEYIHKLLILKVSF